jgi:hypothetical protein
MVVIRDEARIAKLKSRSQQATLVGFLFLAAGFVVIFLDIPNVFLLQTAALILGWAISQVGMYLSHRYARSPRPDEVLDEAIKPVARDGRMYHYILPAPHVLLSSAGPIIFVLKFQTGKINADGDKWTQRGIGFRRLFGQEGLGNPTKDAEKMIEALAGFIRREAPTVEEVPIGAMIVFTSKNRDELHVENSNIPARHFSKVKGFLRQKGLGKKLPEKEYDALRLAFDNAAGDILEE